MVPFFPLPIRHWWLMCCFDCESERDLYFLYLRFESSYRDAIASLISDTVERVEYLKNFKMMTREQFEVDFAGRDGDYREELESRLAGGFVVWQEHVQRIAKVSYNQLLHMRHRVNKTATFTGTSPRPVSS